LVPFAYGTVMNDLSSSSTTPQLNGANIDQNSTQDGQNIIDWLVGLVRGRNEDQNDALREAIEDLIEDKNQGGLTSIAAHERVLISNILRLRDLSVVDIMVPRADILAVELTTPKKELLEIMATHPHSRLPVYRDTLDDVVGTIHIKDVLAHLAKDKSFEIKDLVRDAEIVAPSMPILDLLLQMRHTRVHMALVVDEFGGIDGLITIADIIEAIVGEIDDEHDIDIHPKMVDRPDGSMLADGRVPIEDFEERFGAILEDDDREDIDTLAGLVFSVAGRVPARGEIIVHPSGIEFEVTEADPRRITRMIIRNLPEQFPHQDA